MFTDELYHAVDRLAQVAQRIPEADLDRDWAWGAYDEEGVRFAFFRTYEELRELAALTASARHAAGQDPATAQRILAQYHAAYRDLQAALLGLDDEVADQAPGEGEWGIRETVAHIAGAEAGFYGTVAFALARARSGLPAVRIPDEAWDELLGHDEETFDAIMAGPLAGICEYHAGIHRRVLVEFAGIAETELAAPSLYWEGYQFGVRFRLHRFDSHLRQHTIQVDKAHVEIGRPPTEALRLARLVFAALAEAEGACIGAWALGAERRREAAAVISARTAEIAEILS